MISSFILHFHLSGKTPISLLHEFDGIWESAVQEENPSMERFFINKASENE